jgi:hypothetical protein
MDTSGAFSSERSLELKKLMRALPPQLDIYSCSVWSCLEVMQFIYDYYTCEKCIGTEWTLLIKVHTVLYLSSESRN